MKIHTRTVWDVDGHLLEDECFEYEGPIEFGKDHGEKAASSQQSLDNQRTNEALAQQKAIRDQIMATTSKYTTGAGQGYDPAQLATMISQFQNQNASNFNSAGSSVMDSLRARGAGGGDLPVGGDFTRGLVDLQSARATSQSQGILGVNLSDQQQALNNKFNALNLQSGQSAQVGANVNTFSGATGNDLAQLVKAKSVPGFWQSLATSAAQGAGQAAVGFATGGLSSFSSRFGKPGTATSAPQTGWGGTP